METCTEMYANAQPMIEALIREAEIDRIEDKLKKLKSQRKLKERQ